MDESWYSAVDAFLVVEVRSDGVAGYVVGQGLRVGDRLTRLRRYEGDVTADEVNTRWLGDEVAIDFVVRRITAYGQDHDQWDSGLSALVGIDGDGLNLLGPNVVVATSA